MAGRSSLWTTSQIFFVYDHTILQKEEDDLKDAIIYFSPAVVDEDDQCALCGQLMGMVSFFQATWGAKPHFYQLTSQKFVMIHVEERYTLALGAENSISDHCLEQQLQLLYDTFTMYMGNLGTVRQDCERKGTSFSDALQPVWECFLPFCCAYGDDVRRGFFSLPTVNLPKSGADIFLQASSMLQASKRRPGVLGGAVLSSNGILCTQLSEELTSRFLVIKPQQNHLPCQQVQTDFDLPAGVRIISVMISDSEYTKLVQRSRPTTRHTCMSRFRPTPKSHDPPPYPFSTKVSAVQSHQRNSQTRNSNDFFGQSDVGIHLSSVSSLDCQNISVNADQSKQRHLRLAEPFCGLHRNTDAHSFPEGDAIVQNSTDHVDSYDAEEENSDNEGRVQTIPTVCSYLIRADVHADSSLADQNISVSNVDLDAVDSEAVGSHPVAVSSEKDKRLEMSPKTSATDAVETRVESSANISGSGNNDQKLEHCEEMSGDKKIETSKEISGTDAIDKETEVFQEISAMPESDKKIETSEQISDCVERVENEKVQNESVVLTDTMKKGDKVVQSKESQGEGLLASDAPVDTNRSESVMEASDSCLGLGVAEGIFSYKTTDMSEVDSSKMQEQFTEAISFHTNNSGDSAICVSGDQFQDEMTEHVHGREITVQTTACKEKPDARGTDLHIDSYHGDGSLPNVSSSDTSLQLDEGRETFLFSNNSSQKVTSDSTDRLTDHLLISDSKENRVLSFHLGLDPNSQERPENIERTHMDKEVPAVMSEGINTTQYEIRPDASGTRNLILYIQGYSDSMMILLLEDTARRDKDTIWALWKFALPQLGDLDFRVKELVEIESRQPAQEDYHFLLFNDFQRQVSGNVTKPVTCGEVEFCNLAIDLHEEFHKSASLSELSARTHQASIYAHRSVNHEVYFQSTNKFRQPAGLPNPKDALFSLDQIAQRKLYKNHNITLV